MKTIKLDVIGGVKISVSGKQDKLSSISRLI